MLKMALLDCARARFLPSFVVPTPGIWQPNSPRPREFAIQGKKMLMSGGQPRGGGGRWAQLELTDVFLPCPPQAIY